MFCTICGSWNDDDTIYCSSCGGHIGDNSVTENNNNINNNYNVSSHNSFNNQQNTNSYYNVGNQQNINSDYNMNSQHNTSIVNKDDVNRTKFNLVWNILIVIFSIIGCVCVFFNSYVIEFIRSEEDEIEAYTAVGLNGFDVITGEYEEIIELLGSDFKEAEALMVIEIIYIILVLAFMVLEIVLLFKTKNNIGYITNIITSSVNLSIVFIIKIVLVIIVKEIENMKNINVFLGTGMILLIFMQIIKIILSTMGIVVNGYKKKIDNI